MPKASAFDADKLRQLIVSGRDANDICQVFGIKKNILKTHINKLQNMDRKFYDVAGIDERIVIPKVKKTGFSISLAKMQQYGFVENDEVMIEKQDDGQILIKKK